MVLFQLKCNALRHVDDENIFVLLHFFQHLHRHEIRNVVVLEVILRDGLVFF